MNHSEVPGKRQGPNRARRGRSAHKTEGRSAGNRQNPKTVYTVYDEAIVGNNSDLIAQVADLYFKPGFRIADVTYGKGAFWRKIDPNQYDLFASDLITCPQAPYDFRKLPRKTYKSNSFDAVVLDPPYRHDPGPMILEANYRNAETTSGLNHAGIIQLYRDGMREAHRILKPGGLLLVKCQDEIESGQQRRSHIEIWEIATQELGMEDQGHFILVQKQNPKIQRHPQKHARKNHSFLWLFRKRR